MSDETKADFVAKQLEEARAELDALRLEHWRSETVNYLIRDGADPKRAEQVVRYAFTMGKATAHSADDLELDGSTYFGPEHLSDRLQTGEWAPMLFAEMNSDGTPTSAVRDRNDMSTEELLRADKAERAARRNAPRGPIAPYVEPPDPHGRSMDDMSTDELLARDAARKRYYAEQGRQKPDSRIGRRAVVADRARRNLPPPGPYAPLTGDEIARIRNG